MSCWMLIPPKKFDALGTDFCLHMHKPAGAPKPRTIARFGELKRLRNNQLWPVWLEVSLNHMAEEREQKTAHHSMTNSQLSIPATAIKYALIGEKWPAHLQTVDLTRGPKPADEAAAAANQMLYQANLAERERHNDNKNQIEVLERVSSLSRGFLAVVGILGAGKTRTTKELKWDVTVVGHKTLIAAPTNDTLDHDARTIYNARPEGCTKKLLRLKTTGAETAGLTHFEHVDANPAGKLSVKAQQDALADNSVYHTALTQCLLELETADTEEKLEAKAKELEHLEEHAKAYQKIASTMSGQVTSDPPAEMTLHWRIRDLMRRDEEEAKKAFEAERAAAITKKGLTPEQVVTQVENGTIKAVFGETRHIGIIYISRNPSRRTDVFQENLERCFTPCVTK